MTTPHCEMQIDRLRVLRGMPADTFEYFAALEDVPDDRFTLAVSHALRTRAWFPSPAELRADVDATAPLVAASVLEPQIEAVIGGREVVIANPLNPEQQIVVQVHRVWRFDCDDCADSGWKAHQCPESRCGRRFDHAPHEWVDDCPCREWNPTIRRRKEALGAKYAKSPEKVHA